MNFEEILDSAKNLNGDNIGTAHIVIKMFIYILVLLAVLFLGYRFQVADELLKLEKTENAKKRPVETVEVDLHVTELIDDVKGLSNKEILDIQLGKVETEMKAAIKSHVKRIVFIHGLGQGVLKQEVVKILKSKFPKYYFQDASFKEYGYGATMVILKRK